MGAGALVAGGGVDSHTLTLSLATDTMDFSGLSLIKLKKQEMETQVGAHAHCTATWPPRCTVGLHVCPS